MFALPYFAFRVRASFCAVMVATTIVLSFVGQASILVNSQTGGELAVPSAWFFQIVPLLMAAWHLRDVAPEVEQTASIRLLSIRLFYFLVVAVVGVGLGTFTVWFGPQSETPIHVFGVSAVLFGATTIGARSASPLGTLALPSLLLGLQAVPIPFLGDVSAWMFIPRWDAARAAVGVALTLTAGIRWAWHR